jgi:hypothetical protein
MTRRALGALALVLAVGVAARPAASEEKPAAGAEPRPERAVGAEAERLLRGMGEFLRASPQFSFHAEITFDDLLRSGQKLQLGASNDVVVRRPDRIYSEYVGDSDSKRFWYDGKNVTLYDGRHNVYAVAKAAGSIDPTLDELMKTLGFTPPLADLMYADPYKVLRENVQYGFYVGQTDVGGTRCHHLAFTEQNIDWQIWIEDGTQWVPRKLVITYKTLPGAPQFEALLSHWDLVTRTPDALFAPALPPDAARIEFRAAAAGSPSPAAGGGKP